MLGNVLVPAAGFPRGSCVRMEISRVTLVLVGVLLVLFPSSLVDVRVRGVLWMNGCVPNQLSFCAFKSSVALPLMFWRCVLMPVAWGTVRM